jgi:hypothetical protein
VKAVNAREVIASKDMWEGRRINTIEGKSDKNAKDF